MSRSWNHIELIGNLTRDPELRVTTKGTSVCGFGLATNRSWTNAEGSRQEETAFHRVIAWAGLGEQCAKLLKKGSPVFVSGRLAYREYTKDDEKRMVTEIIIDEMIVLDKKAVADGDDQPNDAPAASPAGGMSSEEIANDVPF